MGTVNVRVSDELVVPMAELLPRISGIDQKLLPKKLLSAPWLLNPGPLIVVSSLVIVIPPATWSVAPVLTTVPSGPSRAVVTLANVPPTVEAVICGRLALARLPSNVTTYVWLPAGPTWTTRTLPPTPPMLDRAFRAFWRLSVGRLPPLAATVKGHWGGDCPLKARANVPFV